jgi:glc operon protein GlcG
MNLTDIDCKHIHMKTSLFILLVLITFGAAAQTPNPPIVMYGNPITLEAAKKVMSAAEAFAISKQWTVAIAIVDTGGNLVLMEKLDNTQVASIEIAIGKAKTANNFKRPTKALEDAVAGGGGGLRILAVPGVFPLEGGEPIFSNGKIIGAIGVSGMQSGQDAEVVKAGLAVLK